MSARVAAAWLLLLALVLQPAASASVVRSETHSIVSESTMDYFVLQNLTGDDARAERQAADTDGSGDVSAGEAAAYATAAAQNLSGTPTASLRWDGVAPVWGVVHASASNLEGPVTSGSTVRVALDGALNLTSDPGRQHTLSVSRPAGFSSWAVTLVLPDNWTFGSASGVANLQDAGRRITASVETGVAVFELSQAAPPGAGESGSSGLSTVALYGLGIGALLFAIMFGLTFVRLWRLQHAPEPPRARPPPPGHGPPSRSFVLEGLLVLYKDGRLVYHRAAGSEGKLENPEVVGSMFSAVADFIRDSFKEDAPLSRLTYGQNTIVVERSTHLFGAAIVYGEPDAGLRELLDETLRRAESAFTGVVEDWNGDREAFAGFDGLVAPLFAGTAGLTRADVRAAVADHSVKLLSETEHFKGYVRLKVALVNDSDAPIHGAAIHVDFNPAVLRLARIDPPAFAREGSTVNVGVVAPGERVGVTYYLDPQTCNQTNIDGRVTFAAAAGPTHTVAMKTRQAEIVCPIFFTKEHANAAMLKRMVETALAARDAKLYRVLALPAGAVYKDLFSFAREAVQRHDVKLIRNFTSPSPFSGKAWFYGQTKVAKAQVIMRASASEEGRSVEFFVAAESASALTGLLAEFNHSFTQMLAQRMPGAVLEPVLDDDLKGTMAAGEFASHDGMAGTEGSAS